MEQKGANCVVDYWQNNWRIVFNKRTNDRVVVPVVLVVVVYPQFARRQGMTRPETVET